MSDVALFNDHNYLNLETYRRTGEALQTPVWFVQQGNVLYIRTVADSGKVKRIRSNPTVRIAPCDRQGQVLGPWVAAQAHQVRGDSAVEAQVDHLLDVKYGELKRQFARQSAEAGRIYTILEVKLDE